MNAVAEAADRRAAYSLLEAARLAHMPTQTAGRWVRGYAYMHKGERRHSMAVPSLAERSSARGNVRSGTGPLLDFEQLLTLLLVKAFHSKGLSIQRIKKAASKAQEIYGVENPFVTRQFKSDGNKVFIDLDPKASGRERQLINLLSDQHEFHAVVEPSLFRDVVFVGERAGQWWPLGRNHAVLVAPDRQSGAPHVANTGVRTDVVADMVEAEGGGDAGGAAAVEWFGLTPDQVDDAVRFEEWLQQPI